MGLPHSLLPLLHNLRKDEKYTQRAKSAVEPFSLFCFIIDSPYEDRRLSEYVGREFIHLHHLTGEDLLFFIPIDEPSGWKRFMEESGGSSVLALYRKIPDSIRSSNPERAQRIFAQTLGVRKQDLPALILSSDLCEKEYFVLRTSRNTISTQLSALGVLARAIARNEKDLSLEVLSRPDIDSCSGLYSENLFDNMAGLLCDSIRLGISSKDVKKCEHPQEAIEVGTARSSLRDRCRDLINQLTEIQPVREVGSEMPANPNIIQNLESLALLLAEFDGGEGGVPENSSVLHQPDPQWDFESKEWWTMGNKVYQFLDQPIDVSKDFRIPEQIKLVDKAPSIVCWSKALENELNLSAGQWIRKRLGVEMPEYFNRFQPDREAIFQPSEKYSLDFNRRHHDCKSHEGLRMLELGPLAGAINWFAKQEGNSRLPLSFQPLACFSENIEQIRNIRNRACHPSSMRSEDGQDFQDAYACLQVSGVLSELCALKAQMSECSKVSDNQPIYISCSGRTYGPYPISSISLFLEDGRLRLDDFAYEKGTEKWQTVQNLLNK
jgi:hypothetical protein